MRKWFSGRKKRLAAARAARERKVMAKETNRRSRERLAKAEDMFEAHPEREGVEFSPDEKRADEEEAGRRTGRAAMRRSVIGWEAARTARQRASSPEEAGSPEEANGGAPPKQEPARGSRVSTKRALQLVVLLGVVLTIVVVIAVAMSGNRSVGDDGLAGDLGDDLGVQTSVGGPNSDPPVSTAISAIPGSLEAELPGWERLVTFGDYEELVSSTAGFIALGEASSGYGAGLAYNARARAELAPAGDLATAAAIRAVIDEALPLLGTGDPGYDQAVLALALVGYKTGDVDVIEDSLSRAAEVSPELMQAIEKMGAGRQAAP